MTSQERVLERERQRGREDARALQAMAPELDGTALCAAEDRIPAFAAACRKMNMLERPAGFVCRSSAGRVVRLLQPYDSAVYTGEPEELPAQWGFAWSRDGAKALPFIALAGSPYMTGDCCTYAGKVWRSGMDNNVWAPGTPGAVWEEAEHG